ncbi:hypothetical protein RB195_009257 [Necator americanus]|uniref:Peptidase S1 domain-containing protein n=1 Tax=Necator americanus TaxID=51031 RepID=A0ABR1CTC4_NECAM
MLSIREKRKVVGNDVKKTVKREIDNDYSADYIPTALDETEEDENDPMRTKVMGGERAAKDELPWAVALVIKPADDLCGGTLISRRHIITAAHCFRKQLNGTCSVNNMLPEGDVVAGTAVALGGTCLVEDKKYNCAKEDVITVFRIKRISYRSYFEFGYRFTRDIAILELADDVPKHIHHICLPHMNKKINIGDPLLRMSSFGWGADPIRNLTMVIFLQKLMLGVRMTEKDCRKIAPEKLSDTFCTIRRPDQNLGVGDSGGGITAKIDGRTYLAGVVSGTTPYLDKKKRPIPSVQIFTDITKYTTLIDSWLGAKKSK